MLKQRIASSMQKVTEDQIKLLILQKDLESTHGSKFVDLPLSDTLYKLMILGDKDKRASKIRNEFKVPDKRYWWIRVKALAEIRDWEQLEKFAKEKKSPIGYEPFVDVCIGAKANSEAVKYIPRVATLTARVEYYMRLGMYKEAAEMTFKEKEFDLLVNIRNRCTHRESIAFIDQLLVQFQSKK